MKTIICLALCLLAVSALSPIDDLSSALEMLDMPNLLDDNKNFDLTVSFSFLGGVKDDNTNGDKVAEQVCMRGTYNLLTWQDVRDQVTIKTGDFNKTKEFKTWGVVNFTGSGGFTARGGGADKKGSFSGGSSTDFVFDACSDIAYGTRKHQFDGEFCGKKSWGEGHIEVHTLQDGNGGNSSEKTVNYHFGGEKDDQRYQGRSRGSAHVYGEDSEEYRAFFSSVFHGINKEKSWKVTGGYVIDVYDSDWENVWRKDGRIDKNGTRDEVFGTFDHLGKFGLPHNELISE